MAVSDTGAQAQSDATTANQGQGAAQADESNEALLAELEAELGTEVAAGKPAGKKPAGDGEEDDDEDGEPGDDVDDLEDDEDATDDEDDEGEEEEVDATKDPELAKRLAAVRRADQRRLERFTRERTEFTREREAFAAEVKQVRASAESFEQLRGRARHDPYSVLSALGVPDEDMEYAGQQLYARSKAAAAKPEFRAAADRAMREREASDKLSAAERRINDVEAKLLAREQQAAADAELEVYFGRVVRKADDATPRVKALLAANPKRARAEFETAAFELGKKLGKLPKAAAVAAAVEKKIARQLRDYGVDAPASVPASTAPAGKKPGAAAKPATAKAKAAGAGDHDDSIGAIYHPTNDELLRELRSGAS